MALLIIQQENPQNISREIYKSIQSLPNFFTCNLLIRESKIWIVTNYWKEKGLISFEETLSVNINLSIRKPFYFR